MSGEWILNNLSGFPRRIIRPETHWFKGTTEKVRGDGALWFSLRLTRDRAEELYNWDRSGTFGKLIGEGARMTRTGRAALRFVLDAKKSDKIGTDILVPEDAFGLLEALPTDGIEITDAGLAVAGESTVPEDSEYVPPAISETAQSTPRANEIPKGSPVIIATIDDGIGIANHRFRLGPAETRVRHFL